MLIQNYRLGQSELSFANNDALPNPLSVLENDFERNGYTLAARTGPRIPLDRSVPPDFNCFMPSLVQPSTRRCPQRSSKPTKRSFSSFSGKVLVSRLSEHRCQHYHERASANHCFSHSLRCCHQWRRREFKLHPSSCIPL